MGKNQKIKFKEPDEELSKKKKLYRVILVISLISLFAFNYVKVKEMLGSNGSYITNFEKPKEEKVLREPAVAGLFYSSNKEQLDKDVEHYLKTSKTTVKDFPKILIVPHAGYKYSGDVAAKAYSALEEYKNKVKKVIIVGPSHHEALQGVALPSANKFLTPLGEVSINEDIYNQLIKNKEVKVFDKAHDKEHSIEVQLPFLQKTLTKFTIIPLAYGNIKPEKLANVLQPFMKDKNTIIIFSADLSHYYSYEHAKQLDDYTAKMILNNDADIDNELSCGAIGINAALILSKDNNFYPKTLDLRNSGDTSGDKSRVVGYGAWSFSENKDNKPVGIEVELENLKQFADLYKDELKEIVQISLEDAVNEKKYKPSRDDYSEYLFDKGASFVTLTKNGELRGCIGTIEAKEAIASDIANSTYNAAMQDKRFDKLTAEELESLDYSISILTNLERVRFLSEEDLISKIIAGKDGLVIVDGSRQGLFLPSVWKDLPDKNKFLQNLKIKAGLSPAYWSNKIKVYRFWTVEIHKNGN